MMVVGGKEPEDSGKDDSDTTRFDLARVAIDQISRRSKRNCISQIAEKTRQNPRG